MSVVITTVAGHYALFEQIRTLVKSVGVGWTELEYDNSTANRLAWFRLPSTPSQDGVHIGMRTYQDVSDDYYNISFFYAIGWVSGNPYNSQPGFSGEKVICCWNQNIKCWLNATGNSLRIGAKIQNIYESAYLGKPLLYATPGQWPYPAIVGGSLNNITNYRYSELTRQAFFKNASNNLSLRMTNGTHIYPEIWIHSTSGESQSVSYTLDDPNLNDDRKLRNVAATSNTADGVYVLYPLVLTDSNNVYGELEGMFYISGFNNATENVVTITGVDYVVLRNIYRTDFNDYIAMRIS